MKKIDNPTLIDIEYANYLVVNCREIESLIDSSYKLIRKLKSDEYGHRVVFLADETNRKVVIGDNDDVFGKMMTIIGTDSGYGLVCFRVDEDIIIYDLISAIWHTLNTKCIIRKKQLMLSIQVFVCEDGKKIAYLPHLPLVPKNKL